MKEYCIGLDIGTDSVGYAAADSQYRLCKFKGEPVWGVTMFEAGKATEERRMARTGRRRLDRVQQRLTLLEEIFAPEILKIDPHFFLRRKESGLFPEDTGAGVKLFDGGITDEEYHQQYPTIHHLIWELMQSTTAHDVRLVYLACAWLIKHRGHFLLDAADGQEIKFEPVYRLLQEYFVTECECGMPWDDATDPAVIAEILEQKLGVKRKTDLFKARVYGGKKIPKVPDEEFPYSRESIVKLLCGGSVKPKDLFANESYAELESIVLSMDEENFSYRLSDLGEDGELLRRLRAVYECALLSQTLAGHTYISEAKVEVYEQHKRDLAVLKKFVRAYIPEKYNLIFREENPQNYVSYSGNNKSCPHTEKDEKGADKDKNRVSLADFSKFLFTNLKNLSVEDTDAAEYETMLERIQENSFLPKQRNSDNRVIPQQLYYAELDCILRNVAAYLPILCQKDESGQSNADKIRLIFHFRIPYYVGPLNPAAKNSWLVRKSGKITPWNFEQMVDLDETEANFIRRMTNRCTYLPGEDVLPQCSLLYSYFTVLNEINPITVNDHSIPVEVKQEIVRELFLNSSRKVTKKSIRDFMRSRGYLAPEDELGGVDDTVKATMKPYHAFRRLLESGSLTEEQVEEIIAHAACSEDKARMDRYLSRTYPTLSEQDRRYIVRLNLKEFGRLSRRLLTGILHVDPETGEALSIMDMLWQTNRNLMQLLSDQYSFKPQIEDLTREYYSAHPRSMMERLDEMYVSNAVKRPIVRTLSIVDEVTKALGSAPKKIFVEMARDADNSQKGKRTKSRYRTILELYEKVQTEDTPKLLQQLNAMGDMAENRLQGDKLFLYFMQMGRCIYTGEPIELSQLATKRYDIDHIIPQSKKKDDSILYNRVLCLSEANGEKSDNYPVDAEIRKARHSWWESLLKNGLMEKEKFNRLTRSTPLTEEELHQFINRQLVETRQSCKVVAELLKEKYPKTEIVYVKAGLVSAFRQEYDLLKSRLVNDLHHAKDAYLNLVVGNVYHEKFTKRWFDVRQPYSLKTKSIFNRALTVGEKPVWRGEDDVALVKKIVSKNAVHLTRYAYCKHGVLFNLQPKKAGHGVVPRKANLPVEKYGGYNVTRASYYVLASYKIKKKKDIMFVPIEVMYADHVQNSEDFARQYIAGEISRIKSGAVVEDVQLLLGGRKIKIDTVIEVDGLRMLLKGKSDKGSKVDVRPMMTLVLGAEMERYVKRLERFEQKKKQAKQFSADSGIQLDAEHDHITPEENVRLYDLLCDKLTNSIYKKSPNNIGPKVVNGRERFIALSAEEQVGCLLSITKWLSGGITCDLTAIGAEKSAGNRRLNSCLSLWKKSYSDVRIVDVSVAGLYQSRSENLLTLL